MELGIVEYGMFILSSIDAKLYSPDMTVEGPNSRTIMLVDLRIVDLGTFVLSFLDPKQCSLDMSLEGPTPRAIIQCELGKF